MWAINVFEANRDWFQGFDRKKWLRKPPRGFKDGDRRPVMTPHSCGGHNGMTRARKKEHRAYRKRVKEALKQGHEPPARPKGWL